MKRCEQKPENCWKLTDIFESDEQWESAFKQSQEEIKKIGEFKGRIAASADEMHRLFVENSRISQGVERLYVYAKMHKDEDNSNSLYQGMTDRAMQLLVAYETAAAYVTPELMTVSSEELRRRSLEKRNEKFRFRLERLERQRKYVLSEKEEKILAMADESLSGAQNIFTMLNDADLKFGEVEDEKGQKIKLTHGTYSLFIKHPDRRIRREAYEKLYQAYGSMKNTIAATYINSVKTDVFQAKVRGHEGTLEAALYGKNIPVSVYEQLIEAVHERLPALRKYVELRKKQLNIDTLEMYDMYTPLLPNCDMKITYEEAQKLVKDALKPLGENYGKLLDKAFSEGWIDVYENDGKKSGAYSWGTYGVHPYVLLNHQDDMNHASTIAHELGHAMHTYHSNAAQPYETAGYSIMVAEVASTVNEVLLTRYLLDHETDKKKKAYFLNEFLETVRATCYRQTMFAEFELKTHRMAEAGEALTVDNLTALYKELNELYYEGVHIDDNIAMEWMRIPHFYRAFYVYQYATGICTAIALASNILEKGEVQRYIDFLSSGGSDYPVELLKKAGVDLTDKNSILAALDVFEKCVDELKELLED